MARAKKPVTLKDLASECGVSIATVSRALAGNGKGVSGEKYRSIIDAAVSRGYNMRSAVNAEPSRLIIACVDSNDAEYFTGITKGIAAVAASYRYPVMVWQHSDQLDYSQNDILDIYSGLRPFGIILAMPTIQAQIEQVSRLYPVIQCAERSSDAVPSVIVDEYRAAETAVRYLLSTGHKRIAFIQNSSGPKTDRRMLHGVWDTLSAAGSPILPGHLISVEPGSSYGLLVSAFAQVFRSNERPDAIFAASDFLATAAVKFITSRGMRVPEDVSVVGFGNTSLCTLHTPSLTSLTYPLEQLGRMSCELLFDQVLYGKKSTVPVVVDSELIVRESSL